ncbi:hypothetical protein GTY65_40085 [Streptomyces sp. SID8379]|uniref:hypothetical protein n=1 Tax=unclassified Streptomyces TaxID=2593676 RepID=UPI00036A7818|nr:MULTISPECIES: hypothetical protein [unclassified Streptomyces]MYW70207.1 hypothetical protein [Streptomyces sp. SID8379]
MHLESQSHSPAALEALTLLRGALRNGYAPASDTQLDAAIIHLRDMLGDDKAARCALLWAMTHAAELSVGVAAQAYDLSPDAVLDQVTIGLQRVDSMH